MSDRPESVPHGHVPVMLIEKMRRYYELAGQVVQFERDHPQEAVPAEMSRELSDAREALDLAREIQLGESELSFEMTGVRGDILVLTTKIATLEGRMQGYETSLADMKLTLREQGLENKALNHLILEKTSEMMKALVAHADREDIDRIKLIRGQNVMLITWIFALAGWLAKLAWEHYSPIVFGTH